MRQVVTYSKDYCILYTTLDSFVSKTWLYDINNGTIRKKRTAQLAQTMRFVLEKRSVPTEKKVKIKFIVHLSLFTPFTVFDLLVQSSFLFRNHHDSESLFLSSNLTRKRNMLFLCSSHISCFTSPRQSTWLQTTAICGFKISIATAWTQEFLNGFTLQCYKLQTNYHLLIMREQRTICKEMARSQKIVTHITTRGFEFDHLLTKKRSKDIWPKKYQHCPHVISLDSRKTSNLHVSVTAVSPARLEWNANNMTKIFLQNSVA